MRKSAERICALLLAVLLIAAGAAAEGGKEAPEIRVTAFRYSTGGYMVPRTYELFMLDGDYYLCLNDEPARRIGAETAEALARMITEYDLTGWNGFHGSNPYVLDGEDFSLSFSLADGTEVSASGNNDFPDRYFEAAGKITELMEAAAPGGRREPTGVYIYEGEGCGGDFTITIARNGTYTFYEGPYSSYMGGGEWSVSGRRMYMTEENGFAMYFTMTVTEDALVYIKDESDGFPYISVPDGGKFVRDDTAEYGKTFRLTFDSFDGGGPSYRVEIGDSDILTYFTDVRYRDENHEEIDGAAYEIVFDFAGTKPGSTGVIIHSESAIAGYEDYKYTAVVDDNLNVRLETVAGE